MVKYKKIFLISFALATFIFFSGFILGWWLDNYRSNELSEMIKQNELSTQSYLVEQEFVEKFGGDSCELAKPRLMKLSSELAYLGRLLTQFGSKRMFKGLDYEYLTQKYFLLEIRSFGFFNDLRDKCGDSVHTILFFYRKEDDSSIKQGYVLDRLVNEESSKVYVFSFDVDFNKDPSLETVKLRFGIKKAPSIVVDGGIVKEGLVSIEELKKLIK